MKIGFIGLGNVGGKLAESLLRNNFDITVRDLDDSVTNHFKDLGAKVAKSPKELAEKTAREARELAEKEEADRIADEAIALLAEQKSSRDARYAARKARKGGKRARKAQALL